MTTSEAPVRDVVRPSSAELVSRIAALAPQLASTVRESDDRRWLLEDDLAAIDAVGVNRIAVPRAFGGYQYDLQEQLDVQIAIGRLNPSLGWVTSLWAANTYLANFLVDAGQRAVFATGSVRSSGVFSPSGHFTAVDGGYTLTGTFKWNTGCRGADWDNLTGFMPTADGGKAVVSAFVDAQDVQPLDDWHAAGLKATGSSTVRVENAFVPAERVLDVPAVQGGNPPADRHNADLPWANYAFVPYVLVSSLGCPLGIAKGALEAFIDRAHGRPITYTSWGDQSTTQIAHVLLGEVESLIDGAEALTRTAAGVIIEAAQSHRSLTVEERSRIRAWVGTVITLCRTAVEKLNGASGASSIMLDVPIQRYFRDISALALHALLLPSTHYEVRGRVLCGLDPDSVFL
jgi:alkylation response protein AidB-like acyl-CoA dehydrogenase